MKFYFEKENFRECGVLIDNILEMYDGLNIEEMKFAKDDKFVLCGSDFIIYTTLFSTKTLVIIPMENCLRIEKIYRMGNVPYIVFAMLHNYDIKYYVLGSNFTSKEEFEMLSMLDIEKNDYDVSDRKICYYTLKKGKLSIKEIDYDFQYKTEKKTIEIFEKEFSDWCNLSIDEKIENREEYVSTKKFTNETEQVYVAKPKPPTVKQQHKINKRNGVVSCPKCGSTAISITNKKISVGKGVAGALVGSLINPVGTAVGMGVGATSSKKIYNVCMNCGHKWKP